MLRLVIGRKGAGKTALFYGVRNHVKRNRRQIVLDLKPEGHQFTRLRETILVHLNVGLQQHTLTAFWHYLLLLEITYKVIEHEVSYAYRNPAELEKFKVLQDLYEEQVAETEGDFSERLMALVNRLIELFPEASSHTPTSAEITNAIYGGDIKKLGDTLLDHLKDADGLWILFDNIDKGFPTHGLTSEDVLIVRCLLEASRKLQRAFEKSEINCTSTVFIRRDVFDHLVDETPDRGKESYANLDWSDVELIRELLLLRFKYEARELEGEFDDVWSRLFDPHVSGESSFRYIIGRTFLRPRDVLNFTRKCIQVAVSRKHDRVEQEDIGTAEEEFSEDMLNELRYEMRDVFPEYHDFALSFLGQTGSLSQDDVDLILLDMEVPDESLVEVRDTLLWFSFLGVVVGEDEYYAYQYLYNINKLKALIRDKDASEKAYIIHPAFRKALEI